LHRGVDSQCGIADVCTNIEATALEQRAKKGAQRDVIVRDQDRRGKPRGQNLHRKGRC